MKALFSVFFLLGISEFVLTKQWNILVGLREWSNTVLTQFLLLDQITKRASFFLREKYKAAQLAFTDVTQTELLVEEVTNNDPFSPEAKTMTRIANASFEVDDYWRVVDVLHRRLYSIDWKQWRQSYKSLVLLEFLLTHGPEEFAQEFQSDSPAIEQLGAFIHIDRNGFNWGEAMQKKSYKILKLLGAGQTLKEERLKALKITKEIQGFGSTLTSMASSSPIASLASPSSATSADSLRSSSTEFWSHSSMSPASNNDDHDHQWTKFEEIMSPTKTNNNNNNNKRNINVEGLKHNWDYSPVAGDGGLLIDSQENHRVKDVEEGEDDEHDRSHGGHDKKQENKFIQGIRSTFTNIKQLSPTAGGKSYGDHHHKAWFRSVSDVGKDKKTF